MSSIDIDSMKDTTEDIRRSIELIKERNKKTKHEKSVVVGLFDQETIIRIMMNSRETLSNVAQDAIIAHRPHLLNSVETWSNDENEFIIDDLKDSINGSIRRDRSSLVRRKKINVVRILFYFSTHLH